MAIVAKRVWRRAGAGLALGTLVALGAPPISLRAQSEAAQSGSRVREAALAASGKVSPEAARHGRADGERARQGQKQMAEVRRPERSLVPAGMRDPFKAPPAPVSLKPGDDLGAEGPFPPGPSGLVINQLRLEGIVREEESKVMIAVVTNATNIAYFLTENEPVYDGIVTNITPDAVYLKENVRDPDRGITSREVVLRLGPTRE